jgi:hypothetical protein
VARTPARLLEARDRNVAIFRRDLDRAADALCQLGGNDRASAAEERVIDDVTRPRVVLDRPLHADDRLLRAVAGFRSPMRDRPDRRLLAIAVPVRGLALAHAVPARLVAPVIVTARDDEARLVPDDRRALDEAAGLEAGVDFALAQRAMPDVGDVAREQRPGRAPVGAIGR